MSKARSHPIGKPIERSCHVQIKSYEIDPVAQIFHGSNDLEICGAAEAPRHSWVRPVNMSSMSGLTDLLLVLITASACFSFATGVFAASTSAWAGLCFQEIGLLVLATV